MTDLRNAIEVYRMLDEIIERTEDANELILARAYKQKVHLMPSEFVWIRVRHGKLKGVNDMAAKTKSRPARSKDLIGCKFGNVSVGMESISLSVKVERSALGLESADHLFTGMRSNALLRCDPNAGTDIDGQQKLDDQEIELETIVECKGFTVKNGTFSARLNINKGDADLDELAKFAARTGSVQLTKPTKIEKPEKVKVTGDKAD